MRSSRIEKVEVRYRQVADLIPYARNARTHSDAQVAQIAASIREFGWTNPVLVDGQNGIIAGHGRVLAAQKLGLAEVPTIELAGLSPSQRRAYVIADNQLATTAGWNDEMLRLELQDLGEDGFDLSLLGFSEDELQALLAEKTAGLTDPDDAPPLPAEPVSRLGDVWVLGRHRIVCGDCTDATVVDKALGAPAAMVDVCFTSPPYGAAKVAKLRDHYVRGAAKRQSFYEDHKDDPNEWADLMNRWFDIASERAGFVMCNVQMLADNKRALHEWVARSLDRLCDVVVWDKGHAAPQMQRGVMNNAFEFIYLFGGNGSRSVPFSDFHGTQPNVVRIDPKQSGNEFAGKHRAVMPVALAQWAMELCSKALRWYEPFSGSGTTIIAGEMTGRHVYAIELSPAYVDVAVKRWRAFTGAEAVLEASGATFAETDAARALEAAHADAEA